MTEQQAFGIYCHAIVGFLGGALIAWEFGKKDFIRVGLEGPKNKRILFAMASFAVMALWQWSRKLKDPFVSWTDLWIPVWTLGVFVVSRLLVPRSVRLYFRAKTFHEAACAGGRQAAPAAIRHDYRLAKAESLYPAALGIQKHLSCQSMSEERYLHHQRNVAITYLQLTLLYHQQARLEEAAAMAKEVYDIAEPLTRNSPEQPEFLLLLSDALFRWGEVEQALGNTDSAKAKYRRSLDIDLALHNSTSADITKARLSEMTEADPNRGGDNG